MNLCATFSDNVLRSQGFKLLYHYSWYYVKRFDTNSFNFKNCPSYATNKCDFASSSAHADALLFHGLDVWPWIYFAPRKRANQVRDAFCSAPSTATDIRLWYVRGKVWIFYTQESPATTLWNAGRFNGLFNWTMTHQSDSDIPIPYSGDMRWIKKQTSYFQEDYTKGNLIVRSVAADKYAARINLFSPKFQESGSWPTSSRATAGTSASACHTSEKCRSELRKARSTCSADVGNHVQTSQLPSYSSALHPSPTHSLCTCSCDIKAMSREYYFYLSFENSLCKDYISEKYFRNGLSTKAVPVVRGGLSSQDYAVRRRFWWSARLI